MRWRLARPHILGSVLVCAAVGGALPFAFGPWTWLEGLLFDLSLAASARVAGDGASSPEPVVVIAVDRHSLDSPELADYPRTLFGPVWAAALEALREAGVQVVAFDLVLAYSGERLRQGYDRPFLAALSSNAEHVVLGRSSTSLPARNYLAALRFDEGALGLVEMAPDGDGVHRRAATRFEDADGNRHGSIVGAALARAGYAGLPATLVPVPRRHPDALPRYALIDVLRCTASEPSALSQAFAGRIVFIGTTLPEEDRKLASTRFLARPAQVPTGTDGTCLRPAGPTAAGDATVPGVLLHAAAASSAIAGAVAQELPKAASAVLAAGAAVAGSLAAWFCAPLAAAALAAAGAIALVGAEAVLLSGGHWLHAGYAVLTLFGAAVAAYLVRFVVEERRRMRIQRAFGRYLAPSLVDRLSEGDGDLALGGSRRDITVMFADLSGFTALSGQISPQALVARTNEYLQLIAGAVDASGGYVDKFIGDAVMAIWGAPAADAEDARNAVLAAMEIREAIAARRAAADRAGEHGFDVKIGINSGDAVVGNVGSENRYNYTAVGEAVNVAARLEPLPAVYGCRLVVGPATAARLEGAVWFRELDAVAVKGKAEPLAIFEPLATREPGEEPPHPKPAYEAALAAYRDRKFAEAAAAWRALAEGGDGPSAIMAARAEAFAATAPPPEWDGVFTVLKG